MPESQAEEFYLTTPIYYVNARPHLGHTYTTVVADTIARYKRMCGYDVVLLTGTDEHGQKVERAAKAAGVTPQAYADRIAARIRQLWKELDLSIDRFIRTTEPRQERAVHRLAAAGQDNGYIYKGHSTKGSTACSMKCTWTSRCPAVFVPSASGRRKKSAKKIIISSFRRFRIGC